MFKGMGQSAFACVPRYLVEAYKNAKDGGDWNLKQEAAREIADAALDDIT